MGYLLAIAIGLNLMMGNTILAGILTVVYVGYGVAEIIYTVNKLSRKVK